MNFVHFIQLIVVLIILIAVGVPLFRGLSKIKLFLKLDASGEEYKHLLVRKEEVLLSIKDLEFLADFNEDESATLKVYLNPMVSWLWTGGWIIAFGTMVCMWPDRLEQRRRLERMKKQQAIFAPAQE